MKKVLKTQNTADSKTQYNLVASEINLDNDAVITYGIEIVESLSSGKTQTTEILGITSNFEKAEGLFEKVVRLEINASSLRGIVDDFIIS